MTTLLDKQRSATSNVRGPDEATLDQVLSRIAALAPVVARHARDIEQGRRLPAELSELQRTPPQFMRPELCRGVPPAVLVRKGWYGFQSASRACRGT
jgi:hypothetical protein